MPLIHRLVAEFIGTFVLVFGGCGAAVLAAGIPDVGIGFLGVSLAFGLTVLVMVYTVGRISGGHFNPAVSLGLVLGRRLPAADLLPYVLAQVAGAVAAAGLLRVVAGGKPGFTVDNTQAGAFATNGYGDFSPEGYSLAAALVVEVVLTAIFLLVILGATDRRAPQQFAGIAIGLSLTLIHLISIPVTNTSVNPARSTGPALFVGGTPLTQLWLFWVAPLVGAAIAGLAYRFLAGSPGAADELAEAQPGVAD